MSEPDNEALCGDCNGSGEGRHDGEMCAACGGLGVVYYEEGSDVDEQVKDPKPSVYTINSTLYGRQDFIVWEDLAVRRYVDGEWVEIFDKLGNRIEVAVSRRVELANAVENWWDKWMGRQRKKGHPGTARR